MRFIEIEKYKVKCILEKSELFAYGVTLDDILSGKPGTFEFMHIIKQEVIKATDYSWPGCAFSSQIEVIDNDSLAITFSETIADFVFNLKQVISVDNSSSDAINELIYRIESADEKNSRSIIKTFETNVRKNMSMGK